MFFCLFLFFYFHHLTLISATFVLNNFTIPYYDLTKQHHKQILSILTRNNTKIPYSKSGMCFENEYGGYSIDEISKLITSDMIKRSFDHQGSFHRLITNLEKKLHSKKLPTATTSSFNILYVGGSVCVGHGCHLCQNTNNLLEYNEASFECSWTHRFTQYFQYLINHLKSQQQSKIPQSPDVLVSPRYCCKSATSTNLALDILITKSYRSPICKLSGSNKNSSYNWEPDLIIWDYSVNDLSSRWFRNRSRRDVYEGFVQLILNMSSQPQLIVLESMNRRLDLKPSDLIHMNQSRDDRLAINRQYNIPMVNYLSALNRLQAPPLSPYYAQLESDRHPGWPTHMLWSQLMTEVILFAMNSTRYHSKPNEEKDIQVSLSKLSTQYNLCLNGYTTYLDFENRPLVTDVMAMKSEETAPELRMGDWVFRGDLLHDPFKTGWIYETHEMKKTKGNQRHLDPETTCPSSSSSPSSGNQTNQLRFRCPNIRYGRVKIGYLASYGHQWGSVLATVIMTRSNTSSSSTSLLNQIPHSSTATVKINSFWSSNVSIRMEKEIILQQFLDEKTSFPLCESRGDEMTPRGCFLDLLVTIQFCSESGNKFKLLSIACC